MILKSLLNEINNNLSFFAIKDNLNQEKFKQFTELVIFYDTCLKNPNLKQTSIIKNIEQFLVDEMYSIKEEDVFQNYYTAYHIILPYITIRKLKKITHLESCLKVILENQFFSSEAPPHRQMEWEYLLYKTNNISNVSLPESSILNKKIYLQYCDRDLMYAITHTLFYLNDFGFNYQKIPVKNINLLKFQLECLIARAYEENDIDLILELGINYFSLSSEIEINYNILELIKHLLVKTDFIEFNCSEKTLKEKYHSLFVLGIFINLLENLTSKASILNASKKQKINTIFNEVKFNLNVKPLFSNRKFECNYMWSVLKKMKSKNYNDLPIKEYTLNFRKINPFLLDEVHNYLQIIDRRNDLDILWNRELKYLNIKNNKIKSDCSKDIKMCIESVYS